MLYYKTQNRERNAGIPATSTRSSRDMTTSSNEHVSRLCRSIQHTIKQARHTM